MTVPGAVGLIEQLAQALPANVLIGAGTVLDPETARSVILAGARFVVSPVFRPEVIALCHRYDVAAMPGCFTPTEILAAWEAGADVVKVFPATALGPGFFKDLRGPLPQVKLMPTGGVTRENAGDWIRAGACAIGVGTALVDRRRWRSAASATSRRRLVTSSARCPTRARASCPRRRRDEDRLLRRDHAAAEPAGLRAVLPVAAPAGDLRWRRSQRRRQPGALRLRQPLRDAAYRPIRSATRRCGP